MLHLFLFLITLLLHIDVLLLLIDVLLFAVQLEGIPHTGAFHFVSGPQGISDCINRRLDGSVDDHGGSSVKRCRRGDGCRLRDGSVFVVGRRDECFSSGQNGGCGDG